MNGFFESPTPLLKGFSQSCRYRDKFVFVRISDRREKVIYFYNDLNKAFYHLDNVSRSARAVFLLVAKTSAVSVMA